MSFYTENTSANKMYCPDPKCSQFINLEWVQDKNIPCPKCDVSLCTNCKDYTHTVTCEQHQLRLQEDEGQLVNLAQEQGWKRCSSCRRFVELTHGCHHMTCLCK